MSNPTTMTRRDENSGRYVAFLHSYIKEFEKEVEEMQDHFIGACPGLEFGDVQHLPIRATAEGLDRMAARMLR